MWSLCRTLPPVWGNAQQLVYLGLNSNRLQGLLPDAWGANNSFPALSTLNLVMGLVDALMLSCHYAGKAVELALGF